MTAEIPGGGGWAPTAALAGAGETLVRRGRDFAEPVEPVNASIVASGAGQEARHVAHDRV